MKKLLLTTAACGLAVAAAAPAQAADGVKLNLGGYFAGYGVYTNQDDDSTVPGSSREIDILRTSEIHFSGETTLDNGLTVGAHIEMEADGNRNGADGLVEESYVYMSGTWGRVNFGSEDGAGFLLQVAAPSSDSIVDGVRVIIDPVNETAAGLGAIVAPDYDMDPAAYDDKLTYLSPVLNGFQMGVSYTPDVADASIEGAENEDDVPEAFGEAYEIAARYEGQFNNVGVNFGAGFIHNEVEALTAGNTAGNASDDRQLWNVGLDLDIGPFGIGVAYMEDDLGDVEDGAGGIRDEEETIVVGVDYTTGPFKLGASYFDQEGVQGVVGASGNNGVEAERYSGGVTYTYGPGMTFRGTVSHIEYDNVAGLPGTRTEADATSVLLGTMVKF